VKLVISPAAADDIEAAARWWDANRPKAPGLFERELLTAFASATESPRAFAVARHTALGELRRAVMPKTRYLVYFLLLDDEVRILHVWHQSRTPPLSL
jgi:plasmid stabilization system protein ParE